MLTAKAEARALLQRLPDDCSFDDIHYHLYVVEKVRRGIESAEQEGTIPHAEMEVRLAGETVKVPIEDDPLMAMAGDDDFEPGSIDEVVYR